MELLADSVGLLGREFGIATVLSVLCVGDGLGVVGEACLSVEKGVVLKVGESVGPGEGKIVGLCVGGTTPIVKSKDVP